MNPLLSASDQLDNSPANLTGSQALRVGIVDEEFPFPMTSGKRIRTWNLLSRLKDRHHLTYIAYQGDSQETSAAVDYLNQQGVETVVVPRTLPKKSGPAFYGRLLANLWSPRPYSVDSHDSPELRAAINERTRRGDVDLWHCEWTPYAAALSEVTDIPWIVVGHNVESLIWERYTQNERNLLKRWYMHQQWKKYERFEKQVFCDASDVVLVSRQDAELARQRFAAPNVNVVDNGVDVDFFKPNLSARDPRKALFLGSLDWRPNQDAVRQMLDSIIPAVHAVLPDTVFSIVGRKPPEWMRERAAKTKNVELHGDVPDTRPYLHEAAIMIVPLRIGGGSRLKILESLATELPVVSTRIGAEGLELSPQAHFTQVETVDEIAGALIDGLQNRSSMEEQAHRGRARVLQRFDWNNLATRLEQAWLNQVSARRDRSSRT